MQDFIAAVISFFLVEPLHEHLNEMLAKARVPQAVVNEVISCAQTAAPVIVERAASDPWWAVFNGIRLWAGWVRPDALLVDAAPRCAPAVHAARPFLIGERQYRTEKPNPHEGLSRLHSGRSGLRDSTLGSESAAIRNISNS